MKYTQKTSPEGKPAIYCERGIVCQFEAGYQQAREQDAAFIVRACNAHDQLVAALEDAEFIMRQAGKIAGPMQDSFNRSAQDARAALAKAKGEQ